MSPQEVANTMAAAAQSFRNGDSDNASILCTKLLRDNPANVDALCLQGVIAVGVGLITDGIAVLEKALDLEPGNPVVQAELGRACKADGRLVPAIEHLRRAANQVPDEVSLQHELGNALLENGDNDQAIIAYRRVLALNPHFAAPWNNLGVALRRRGHRLESLSCFRRAVERDPNDIGADINIGVELKEQGHLDEALTHYSQILERHPDNADAHFHRAVCRLLCGDFQRGWPEYEYRPGEEDPALALLGDKPTWDGGSLDDQTIWVGCEQGVGDQIMYASCVPELLRLAGHVVLSCDQRLAATFRRSFPRATVVGNREPAQRYRELGSKVTTQIASASIPGLLKVGTDFFPDGEALLIPDPDLVQLWGSRLGALGRGLKVGISWRGGGKPESKLDRTVGLSQWAPVLSVPGVQFVNLQYDKCGDEVAEVQSRLGIEIHDWQDLRPLDELDNISACIACVDLVISIDNSTVHLAGALGTPVWILLPFVPEWRWLVDTDHSYWYRSARLLRQRELGKWEPVLGEARRRLRAMVSDEA